MAKTALFTTTQVAASGLVEVRIHTPPRSDLAQARAVMLVILAILLLLMLNAHVQSSLSASGTRSDAATGITALLTVAVIGLVAWVALWSRRKPRVVIDAENPTAAVAELFKRTRTFALPAETVKGFARRFAAAGYLGQAFRICAPGRAPKIEPILTHFAPRPLDELDAEFDDLYSGHALRAAGLPSVASRRKRLAAVIVAAILLIFPLGVIAILWSFWARNNNAHLLMLFIVLSALVATAFVVIYFLEKRRAAGARHRPPMWATWMLVPSGLLLHWSDGPRYRVRVLDRKKHVLFVYTPDLNTNRWRVVAANTDHTYTRRLSATEAEMLLCAWLSPLPPPEETRLSDWTGHA